MHQKPKGRAVPPNQTAVSQQMAQMTGAVETAQRYASQMAQMTGAVETAQRYASQIAQMTGTAETAQRFAAQVMQTTGAAALVERYATQLAQITAAPMADLSWVTKMSFFPAADLTRALNRLPSRLRNRDTTELFKPLLESTGFGFPDGSADALASWAEERLTGADTATPERFAEIVETFADVELDEETERQLEHLAQDEPGLTAVMNSWGLRLSPKTRADVLALAVLGGFTGFMLLFVGFLAAPVLTGFIMTSIGGGVAAGKKIYGMSIKYTPEARAQLDAATGPSDEEQMD